MSCHDHAKRSHEPRATIPSMPSDDSQRILMCDHGDVQAFEVSSADPTD